MLCAAASPTAAEVPRVATDIAPVQSLVARVMEGLGTPDQVVRTGASPHGYAMRPSEAEALAQADAVFWIGPELTPWLERAIENVAPDAAIVELLDAQGTFLLEFRSGARFADHGDGHDHAGSDDHGVASLDGHGDEGHGDEGHGDEGHGDEGHGGEQHSTLNDDHDHSGNDPHAWLDPDNAKLWLGVIAQTLGQLDPPNADAYAANAAQGQAEIDAEAARIEAVLAPLEGLNFVVFHDAYHYFEHHFGLPAAGAIAAGDASDPGPARIEEVRGIMRDLDVACVLSEPALNPAFVDTVIEGTDARAGVIDPLGADLAPGPGLYIALMRDVADRLAACAG
jgi:zinc transport system substrate-binding protein